MPIRPLVANGIAATSAAPTTTTTAPMRTVPAGTRARPKTTKHPISARPTATAAVTACPGSLIAMPQMTSSAEIPVAGPAAECRGSPAIAMIAAPSSREAATISAPASRAESIAEA